MPFQTLLNSSSTPLSIVEQYKPRDGQRGTYERGQEHDNLTRQTKDAPIVQGQSHAQHLVGCGSLLIASRPGALATKFRE